MQRPIHKQLEAGEQGQSSLEVAFLLPVLLLLVTGMANFGLTMRDYAALTDAVNIGARQLAISRGQTVDPCSTGYNAVVNAAPNLNPSQMQFTTIIAYGTATNTYTTTSCSSPNTYSGSAGNLQFSGTVRLTVTYPCTLWRYGNAGGPCTLTASTLETVQ